MPPPDRCAGPLAALATELRILLPRDLGVVWRIVRGVYDPTTMLVFRLQGQGERSKSVAIRLLHGANCDPGFPLAFGQPSVWLTWPAVDGNALWEPAFGDPARVAARFLATASGFGGAVQ